MEERQISAGSSHRVVLSRRKQGSITGVRDVIAFDAKEVILDTEDGLLTLRGSELHVNRLTVEKGEIELEGQVDSLVYSTGGEQTKESLISRLFG
jgi:sporulation protein YabP